MCNNDLVKYAEVIKNRYKFDIETDFDSLEFIKVKLQAQKALEKYICNILYKKVK